MTFTPFDAQNAAPVDAAIAEKTAECLALRIRGFSYRKIAATLPGVTRSMAHRYVIAALTEIREQNSESANELRQIELERLDVMQAQLTPADAHESATLDPRTADTILRIMERRAKLVGLDTINAPPAANLAGEITVRVKRDDDVLTPDVPPST